MIAIKKDKNKKALLSKHITLEKVPKTDKPIKKRKTKKNANICKKSKKHRT